MTEKNNGTSNKQQNGLVRKSTCVILIFFAFLVGAFAGNTITMLMLADKQQPQQASMPPVMPEARKDPMQTKLEAATVSRPNDSVAWAKLGHYYFDHDMPAKAVPAYEKSLALAPEVEDIWSDLGVMYRRTGQYEKAVQAFDRALQINPEHITARFNKGIVLLHDLHRKEDALNVWETILKQNPDATTPGGQPLRNFIQEVRSM